MDTGELSRLLILFSVVAALAVYAIRWRKRNHELATQLKRYTKIISIEATVARLNEEVAVLRESKERSDRECSALLSSKAELGREVSALQDKIDLAEIGHYDLREDLESSETYRLAVSKIKDQQKAMLQAGSAAVAATSWTVNGSEKEGKKLSERNIKMALRAFNNECEVIISRVSWRNYEQSKDRIIKSAAAIDKLNDSNSITLSKPYINLRLKELEATYRERQAIHQEKERLREEREAAREEEKAQRELQAEIRRAEKDESTAVAAIDKARGEAAQSSGAVRAALEQRIQMLEEKLRQAQLAKERARSMAEQTRVGHIYVISNFGAFGKDVFKIGMTRRLDPLDRVRELGDASVPFPFDVHALVFTEDAPRLERELHAAFAEYRLNLINEKKEFFRIPRDNLKEVLRRRIPASHFIDSPYSQDLVQTLSIMKQRKGAMVSRES